MLAPYLALNHKTGPEPSPLPLFLSLSLRSCSRPCVQCSCRPPTTSMTTAAGLAGPGGSAAVPPPPCPATPPSTSRGARRPPWPRPMSGRCRRRSWRCCSWRTGRRGVCVCEGGLVCVDHMHTPPAAAATSASVSACCHHCIQRPCVHSTRHLRVG